MNKIIVHNQSAISDEMALHYVARVISEGRVSDNGKSYCFGTRWTDKVMVCAKNNSPTSDTFYVMDDKHTERQ